MCERVRGDEVRYGSCEGGNVGQCDGQSHAFLEELCNGWHKFSFERRKTHSISVMSTAPAQMCGGKQSPSLFDTARTRTLFQSP